MQQHGPGIAMGISDATASVEPHVGERARVEPEAAPAPAASRLSLDEDDDDDDPRAWRRRRHVEDDDEREGAGERPPQDPDQVERQKRVEVYRRLWEQDSTRSIFVRPESPPPRPWKPANTWATGRF